MSFLQFFNSFDFFVFQDQKNNRSCGVFINLIIKLIFNFTQNHFMSIPCISEVTTKSIHMQYQQLKHRQLKRFKLKYQYPANLSVAHHHQTASRIQAYNDSSEVENQRCTCCDLPCQIHQISVCEQLFQRDSNDSKINIGRYTDNNVSILFYILKITALFYFLRNFLVQILRWTLLNRTKYCAQNQSVCRLQNMTELIALPSLLYSNSQLLQMQVFISAIVLVISILFYITYRYFLFKHFDLISASRYYQDQYTLFVDNVSFLSVLQAQIGEDILNASMKVREKNEFNLQESFVDRASLKQTNNPQALIQSSLQLYFMSLVQKIKKRLEKKVNQNAKLSQVQQRLYHRLSGAFFQNQKENIVKEVVFCYDLAEISRLQELIEKTMLEIQDSKDQSTYLDPNSLNYTPKRVNFLIQKLLNLQKYYCRAVTSDLFLTRFQGCAFVSFQFSELKDYLLQFHQNNLRVFYDDTKFLKLEQAQAAQCVTWSNFKTTRINSWKSQIESVLVLTFISGLFVLAIVMLKQLFKNTTQLNTQAIAVGFNALTGLLLSVFYNIILKLTQILGYRQSHSSHNTIRISRLIKSFIFGLLLLISSVVIYSQMMIHRSKQTPLKIMKIFSFFILFQTLYNLVPFSYIMASIKYSKYKSQQTIYAFQIQLNRQIQLKQFDIVEVVMSQMIAIFFTSFYSHFVFFRVSSLGFVLLANYWIFKYSLIKFYSLPKKITRKLTEIIIQLFEFQIIMFTLGSFFSLITNSSISQERSNYFFTFGLSAKQFVIVQLIVASIYKTLVLIWPRGVRINKQKKQITYSQAFSQFPYHYDIQSPTTKFWNSEESRPCKSFNFPFESLQNQELKKKSTNVDKQVLYIGSIQISKEYSMSKKRGTFPTHKPKNNLK